MSGWSTDNPCMTPQVYNFWTGRMPGTALNPLTSIAPGCLMGQVTPGRFKRCSLRVRMSRPLEDSTDKSRPRHGFRQASRSTTERMR